MPLDHDKDVYTEPPPRTPVVDKQTTLPNPALILAKLFYYSVDLPVTTFRGENLLFLSGHLFFPRDVYSDCNPNMNNMIKMFASGIMQWVVMINTMKCLIIFFNLAKTDCRIQLIKYS
uniref:Uncharacterized protein n=1 Tax=Astyanax mexicanus TaxID=7994 RepID=A0A8B9RAR2_ASTMX